MLNIIARFMPNPEQSSSLFRTALQVAGTWLATQGYIEGSTWTAVSGAILVLLVTAYGSLYKRMQTSLIASAAAVPQVAKIVTDPETAAVVPSLKVVAG